MAVDNDLRTLLARAALAERTLVVVEGESDRVALETLAERRGRDLETDGAAILAIGGAQAVGRVLEQLGPNGLGVQLAGLFDAGEERYVARALERAGLGRPGLSRAEMEAIGFFVCDRDLEDELISAVGADAVVELLAVHGDLGPFRTLQKQPQWQGRPTAQQLRRFMGSGGRRKLKYARLLVEALDLDRVPRPLDGALGFLPRADGSAAALR